MVRDKIMDKDKTNHANHGAISCKYRGEKEKILQKLWQRCSHGCLMAQLSDTNAALAKTNPRWNDFSEVLGFLIKEKQIMEKISLAWCKGKLLSTNPVSSTVIFLSRGTNKERDWDRSIIVNMKTSRPRQVLKDISFDVLISWRIWIGIDLGKFSKLFGKQNVSAAQLLAI